MTHRSSLIGKQRHMQAHIADEVIKVWPWATRWDQVPVRANLTPAKSNLWAGSDHELDPEIETL